MVGDTWIDRSAFIEEMSMALGIWAFQEFWDVYKLCLGNFHGLASLVRFRSREQAFLAFYIVWSEGLRGRLLF